MIGMAKSCKGGTTLANYVMKPEKGYELLRNGVAGETPTEMSREMRIIQDLNQRAVKRTLSLVISPEESEGKKLTDNELRDITKDYLEELGIDPDKQQFIAFVHDEKSHKHVHIIANRVRVDGRLIKDHWIGKKAQWAAHRVAKKHKLISAKERMIANLKDKEHQKDLNKVIKKEIIKKHKFVMKQNPSSMQEYFKMMNDLNVQVTPTVSMKDRVQGMRMQDLATKKDFKASDVHRDLSLIKIMKSGIPYETSDDNKPRASIVEPFEALSKSQGNSLSNVSNEEDESKKKRKRRKFKR